MCVPRASRADADTAKVPTMDEALRVTVKWPQDEGTARA